MNCPDCQSSNILQRVHPTSLGYLRYQCHDCGKRYNERSGTLYNYLEYPTDIVELVIFHYVRYKLSYEEVAEIFSFRGFHFCGETVRLWVQRFGVLLAKNLRKARHGRAGRSWYTDETYVKIEGYWYYLYRARDREGNLIDVYLSQTRDKKSAIRFFQSAVDVTGCKPDCVTTDKNPAYPDAIWLTLGAKVKHRTSIYLNNLIEQDHRGIKSRYGPMKGFKNPFCAMVFCTLFEEVRNFIRHSVKTLGRSAKRRMIPSNFSELQNMMSAG